MLIAAATGTVGGLLLGMVLWGGEEKKGNLSARISSIGDIVSQLENLSTKEANELKDQIKDILGSVEDLLGKDSAEGEKEGEVEVETDADGEKPEKKEEKDG